MMLFFPRLGKSDSTVKRYGHSYAASCPSMPTRFYPFLIDFLSFYSIMEDA